MKKCLKITFPTPVADQFLQLIHRQARTLKVEGTLAVIQPEQLVRIIVCGEKDEVDHFLDFIHKEGAKHNIIPLWQNLCSRNEIIGELLESLSNRVLLRSYRSYEEFRARQLKLASTSLFCYIFSLK